MRLSEEFQPAAILLAVATCLALLVGLVRSGGRGAAHERELGEREHPRASAATAEESRRTPVLPAADELAPVHEAPLPAPREIPPAPPPAPARLIGFVTLQDGSPAADAQVVLGPEHARCRADGRFELERGEAPDGADLVAWLPGYEPALRASFGANGASGEVHLVLGAPTLTISGTVVDPDGSPLEGWTVELDGLDPLADLGLRASPRTDSEGRFELDDVPAGVHVLRAWKERRELAERSAPTEAGATGVTIVGVE